MSLRSAVLVHSATAMVALTSPVPSYALGEHDAIFAPWGHGERYTWLAASDSLPLSTEHVLFPWEMWSVCGQCSAACFPRAFGILGWTIQTTRLVSGRHPLHLLLGTFRNIRVIVLCVCRWGYFGVIFYFGKSVMEWHRALSWSRDYSGSSGNPWLARIRNICSCAIPYICRVWFLCAMSWFSTKPKSFL